MSTILWELRSVERGLEEVTELGVCLGNAEVAELLV